MQETFEIVPFLNVLVFALKTIFEVDHMKKFIPLFRKKKLCHLSFHCAIIQDFLSRDKNPKTSALLKLETNMGDKNLVSDMIKNNMLV